MKNRVLVFLSKFQIQLQIVFEFFHWFSNKVKKEKLEKNENSHGQTGPSLTRATDQENVLEDFWKTLGKSFFVLAR